METTTALEAAAALETMTAGWGEWALLFVRLDSPGFWLLVDLLSAAALAAALAVGGARQQRWSPLLRAVRRLLIPALALLSAAVAPQSLGISGLDWQAGLRLGLPLAAGVLALLALVRLAVRFEPGEAPSPASRAEVRRGESGALPFVLLYSGAQQLHWCFQRAALLALIFALPEAPAAPAYWAMWAATLLAAPELLLLRGGWARLWSLVALAATAILFLYTRNFWLCWVLHAGILLLAGPETVRALPATRPAARPR